MPFPSNLAKWLKRVVGGRSMMWYYSENRGWYRSDKPAEEIDHIIPESQCLYEGNLDPNHSYALPISHEEHTGDGVTYDKGNMRLANPYEEDFSMHPDMGDARKQYRMGNKQAFKEAAERHKDKLRHGERIKNGDEGMDEFYMDQMKTVIDTYTTLHPEDPKPKIRKHLKFRKKHWTDWFFGD